MNYFRKKFANRQKKRITDLYLLLQEKYRRSKKLKIKYCKTLLIGGLPLSNQKNITKKIAKILSAKIIDIDVIIRTLTLTCYNLSIPYYSYFYAKKKIKKIDFKIVDQNYIINYINSTDFGKTPIIKELETLYLNNVCFISKIIYIVNDYISESKNKNKLIIINSSRISNINFPGIYINLVDNIENRVTRLIEMEKKWGFEITYNDGKRILEFSDNLDKKRFFFPYKENTKTKKFNSNIDNENNIVKKIIKYYKQKNI